MDGGARPEKNAPMPLPASSIDKLSDHSGSYVLCISCTQCRHAREMEPRSLANILGWNITLKQACLRLRCSKCQSRKVRVEVVFNRRPRGWCDALPMMGVKITSFRAASAADRRGRARTRCRR